MAKYNTLFKQQVIKFYLQNGKNCSLTRKHFQLARRTLIHWINQFNYSEINWLAVFGKEQNYSPKFKINVIQVVKMGNFLKKLTVYTLVLLIQMLHEKRYWNWKISDLVLRKKF
ncbi:hypothetical protein BV011_00389 [Haemophilus influenzae]|nr:hypothetical protein BV011_00389 [Haemophilus influenzae]